MLACRSRGAFVDPASERGCVPVRDPESGCFMSNAAESEDGRGDAKKPMPCGICLELIRFAAFMSVFFRIFVLPHGCFRESILLPETPAKAAVSSATPPFRRAGRNNCNLYNIISKCPECKLKWRKSQDLFASNIEQHSVRSAAPDGNTGTHFAGTPKMNDVFDVGGWIADYWRRMKDQFDGICDEVSVIEILKNVPSVPESH